MMPNSPVEEMAALRRSAARAGCTIDTLAIRQTALGERAVGRVLCRDGWGAARLLLAQSQEDATSAGARDLALLLRAQYPDDRSFARAVHRFVKDNVRFVREKGELFTGSSYTLGVGAGDCDDHARVVYAIAEAGGLPAVLAFLHHGPDGAPTSDPTHAVAQLCIDGRCFWAETTIDADFGEHPLVAAKRLGLLDEREDLAEGVLIMGDDAVKETADQKALYMLGLICEGEPLSRDVVKRVQARLGGLAVDGLIGPRTRAAIASRLPDEGTRLGYLMAVQSRVTEARAIMAQAVREQFGYDLRDEGREMLLAIAYLETQFGSPDLGWEDSHNWGGVTYNPKRGEPFVSWGSLDHPDKDKNGNPVVYRFQRYPSDLEGAKDMARIALRTPQEREAAVLGTPEDLAAAMYDAGYYTGVSGSREDRIQAYANAMRSAMAKLGSGAVNPTPPRSGGDGGASGGGLLIAGGALLVALVGGLALQRYL